MQLDYAHRQRSRAKQTICESISYHDTILGRIFILYFLGWWGGKEREGERERERGGNVVGGFAFAVQPHREVRPESGLVGIAEHIVINKR